MQFIPLREAERKKVTAISELQMIVYQLERKADKGAAGRRGKESNKGGERQA